MAAKTNLLPFTAKSEPVDVHIGADIKVENLEDSPGSSEEPTAVVDIDLGIDIDIDRGRPSAGGDERTCGSVLPGDTVRDLSSIDESPAQPILKSFPVSVIAGKPRRFTAHWYSKYLVWLEYSVEKDAIFCKACRHFGNNLVSDKFTRGFRNWKRTHQACSKHELSKAHNTALSKYVKYKECQEPRCAPPTHLRHPGSRLGSTPESDRSNRDHVRVILDMVMFRVRQHRDQNDPGDFHDLFELLSKYDPRMKSRLDAVPKNKHSLTLSGQDIQNDLIDAAASLLLRQIKQELHDTRGTYYTVLADECSDRSERHLVAVCLRYLYGREICVRERVVGFVDTDDTSAEGIALKIVQILEPFELDPGLCVGFGFDGASVLSGVQSILKRTFTRALYVHCHARCLTSVLCEASRGCPDFKTFSKAVSALCLFLTRGPRIQARFLEIQKEMHPDRPPLKLTCDAQTHLSSVADVFSLFDAVLETLTEFAESGGQAGLEAQSLLQQVQTRKFVFLLVASCRLVEVSECASEGLQGETLSLTECIQSVESLKQNLAHLRHSGFDRILTVSNELAEKNEIENWDVSFSRKRKLPIREDSSVSASLGKSTRVRCADDLRWLWHQILDSQINELDSRFHPDSYCLMKAAAALTAHDKSNLAENLHPVSKSYGVEVPEAELFAFSQDLRRISSPGGCLSLIEVFDTCSEVNFPNLRLLLRILLTLPITACTADRMCSSVNKIKTASRSTMLTAQLNPLSLLSFEKDLTDALDYDEIIDIFHFIKLIKPFISQGGKVELANRPLLTLRPMVPV